jgi:hypothetical protein
MPQGEFIDVLSHQPVDPAKLQVFPVPEEFLSRALSREPPHLKPEDNRDTAPGGLQVDPVQLIEQKLALEIAERAAARNAASAKPTSRAEHSKQASPSEAMLAARALLEQAVNAQQLPPRDAVPDFTGTPSPVASRTPLPARRGSSQLSDKTTEPELPVSKSVRPPAVASISIHPSELAHNGIPPSANSADQTSASDEPTVLLRSRRPSAPISKKLIAATESPEQSSILTNPWLWLLGIAIIGWIMMWNHGKPTGEVTAATAGKSEATSIGSVPLIAAPGESPTISHSAVPVKETLPVKASVSAEMAAASTTAKSVSPMVQSTTASERQGLPVAREPASSEPKRSTKQTPTNSQPQSSPAPASTATQPSASSQPKKVFWLQQPE